jgi:hypothetical protein
MQHQMEVNCQFHTLATLLLGKKLP